MTAFRCLRRVFPYVVLTLAVGAVFFPGITDGHLSGDDVLYTCGCRFVRDGLTLSNLRTALTDVCYGAIWMPLTFVTYMLDVSLFGGGWTAHHAVSVALHVATACLTFAFLRMLSGRFGRGSSPAADVACLLAALVWAVHPMRADAVTWIASRKEILWTLFALLGLMAWIRRLETERFRWTALTFACFALACLSKSTAVCFPLLAAAVGVALRGRKGLPVRVLAPMFLMSAAVGAVAVYSQSHPADVVSDDAYCATPAWRLLNAGVSLGMTVVHVFWPASVHHEYRAVFGGWPVDGFLGLAVLAAAVLAVAVLLLTCGGPSRKTLGLSVLWFLIGIGPTLGLLRLVNGDQAYADRYAYLPTLAFSFVVAQVLLKAFETRGRKLALGLALAALGTEVALAVPVVRSLQGDFSAYSRSLKHDPEHWRALRVVGNEFCARQGRMDDGVRLLRKSLRIRPSRQTADSLAYVLAHRGAPGDFAEVRRLGRAAAADPKRDPGGMMLDALGVVSFRERDLERAIRYFMLSLAAPQRDYDARHTRGNLQRARAAQAERQGKAKPAREQ